jgi:hypothetical protein
MKANINSLLFIFIVVNQTGIIAKKISYGFGVLFYLTLIIVDYADYSLCRYFFTHAGAGFCT